MKQVLNKSGGGIDIGSISSSKKGSDPFLWVFFLYFLLSENTGLLKSSTLNFLTLNVYYALNYIHFLLQGCSHAFQPAFHQGKYFDSVVLASNVSRWMKFQKADTLYIPWESSLSKADNGSWSNDFGAHTSKDHTTPFVWSTSRNCRGFKSFLNDHLNNLSVVQLILNTGTDSPFSVLGTNIGTKWKPK